MRSQICIGKEFEGHLSKFFSKLDDVESIFCIISPMDIACFHTCSLAKQGEPSFIKSELNSSYGFGNRLWISMLENSFENEVLFLQIWWRLDLCKVQQYRLDFSLVNVEVEMSQP